MSVLQVEVANGNTKKMNKIPTDKSSGNQSEIKSAKLCHILP